MGRGCRTQKPRPMKNTAAAISREGSGDKMSDIFAQSGTFTRVATDWLYDTVDHEKFGERDAELIYKAMEEDFKPVHFGQHLQHFIFKKLGMEGEYTDLSVRDYQAVIVDAFRDHGTPASFTPTTAKLSALAKNWLTQQSVKRQAVLLLGFGLKMSVEEVNGFLYKTLHEPLLNDQNPFEKICMYCYQHGYGYFKFQQLWQIYEQSQPSQLDMKLIYDCHPAGREESYAAIHDDSKLLSDLADLKKHGGDRFSDLLFARFLSLYDQARDLIAEMYSQSQDKDDLVMARRLQEKLEHNDRLYDYEKQERVRRAEDAHEAFTREDITESDLEHILCSAIPVDKNGNLIPAKRSALNAQFEGKRFSRKHINDILLRKSDPERFDLITLNFLIYALQVDREPNAQRRFDRFIQSTDSILKDCYMGPLYVVNPYECFVIMCILSVSPLETYTDVIERSYQEE